MKPAFSILLAAVCSLSCVTSTPHAGPDRQDTALELGIAAGEWSESASKVRVWLRNRGNVPVGITETFLLPEKYFYLEIEGPSGPIEYPIAAKRAELFGVRYQCLKPGHGINFEVDLSSWLPTVSGEERGSHSDQFAFALDPGRYRIRAVYFSDEPRAHPRCKTDIGPLYSSWIDVAIPAGAER